MSERSRPRRIRVRGRQREDIDLDLLAQALIQIAEDQVRQREEQAAKLSEDSPESHQ